MKAKISLHSITGLFRLGLVFVFLLGLFGSLPQTGSAQAQGVAPSAPDPNPPGETVKLIFIHHSTGENWLRDDYGGLGLALSQNNYFVSDTNYHWGPNSIGDRTDIPNWTEWFASADTPTYMAALFTEYGQHASYTRTLADPGGENEIVMFKSCFPNSALEGNPNDPPSPDGWLTVGHAKYVYNQILVYFGAHPEKLFVVITAPPLSDGIYAANARAFNQWLMYNWLPENNYTQTNVAVFDFYNVLTGPNNHHRFINGAEEHVFTPGMNTLYYPSGDDHPSVAGSQKATDEFIELLNVFYHRWNTSAPTCHNLALTSNPVAGGTTSADLGPNCGTTSYSAGTSVNLTATANFGYTFVGWSGDASGSANPISITMDGDRTVTANFGPASVQPPDGASLPTNRPTFDWPDIPGAASYQLQVSQNSAFSSLAVNQTTTASTYLPTVNLPANTLLYWRVRTKAGWVYGPWSPVWNFTTGNPPSVPALNAPANNALVSGPSPLFDWKDATVPSGAVFDHYRIQIATDSAFSTVIHDNDLAGITNSQDNTAVLPAGATYYWRVRSYAQDGDYSAWSVARSVKIKYNLPTLLGPANTSTVGSLKPVFTWNVVVGASNYTIQISKTAAFGFGTTNANIVSPTYTPGTNLLAHTTYYWRVRVNGTYGPSNWSVVFSFTTP
jgi:uncharacterized repeat protein (TIGR02543 family)